MMYELKTMVIGIVLFTTCMFGETGESRREIGNSQYSLKSTGDGVLINETLISKAVWEDILDKHPLIDKYFQYNIKYNNKGFYDYLSKTLEGYGIYASQEPRHDINTDIRTNYGRSQLITSEWITTMLGSRGGNEEITGVAVDGGGFIYIVGTFECELSMGSYNLNATNSSKDVFIAKLDSNFNVVWVSQGEVLGNVTASGISVTSSGESVITGSLNNGSISFANSTLYGENGYGLFVAKFSANGNNVWASEATAERSPSPQAIAIDELGNTFITGSISGDSWFGDQHIAVSGQNDVFTSKINSEGVFQWAARYGNGAVYNSEMGNGISLDAQNNVYIAASGNNPGSQNGYLLKYDEVGNLIWAKDIGRVYSVCISEQNELYVISYNGTNSGNNHTRAEKRDLNGNVIWYNSYSTVYPYGSVLCRGPNGSVYWVNTFDQEITLGSITLTPDGWSNSFVANVTSSGSINWVQPGKFYCNAITPSVNGTSYLAGSFNVSQQFGQTTITNMGGNDAFIAQVSSSGTFVTAASYGGGKNESGKNIITSMDGSTYQVGTFEGSITVGNSTITTLGSNDIFIAKYTSAGEPIWVTQAGGGDYDYVAGVDIDDNENVYITGHFGGRSANFGVFNVTSTLNPSVYVAKLDSSGSFIWANSSGGLPASNLWDYQVQSGGITADPNGNCFITGLFRDNVSFGFNTLESNTGNSWESNVYIAKVNASGAFMWSILAGGGDYSCGSDIINDSNGNLYVSGSFSGQNRLFGSIQVSGPDDYSILPFYSKLGTNGIFQWVSLANARINSLPANIPLALTDDNLIAAGIFSQEGIFGDTVLNSVNGGGYISKLTTFGSFVSTTQFPATPYDISINLQGKIYCAASFYNTIHLGDQELIAVGNPDVAAFEVSTGNVIEKIMHVGGLSGESAYGISCAPNNRIILSGNFSSNLFAGFNELQATAGSDAYLLSYDLSSWEENLRAYFTTDITSGFLPLTVTFTDQSTFQDSINTWYWDFGDGSGITYSNYQDEISHTYYDIGEFNVKLKVSTSTEVDSVIAPNHIETLHVPINANFTTDILQGIVPLYVVFSDVSTPTDSVLLWDWDFGDGRDTTYVERPIEIEHIYESPGIYDVKLIIHSNVAADSLINRGLIKVYSGDSVAVRQDGSGDYTTIQGAINACDTGSKIYVAPGNYEENLVIEKYIHLYGSGPDQTFISNTANENNGYVISVQSSCIIDGFSITRTAGSNSFIDIQEGIVTIQNNLITAETSESWAYLPSLISVRNSSVVQIINNTLIYSYNNVESIEGGNCVYVQDTAFPEIRNNIIYSNNAGEWSPYGIASYSNNSIITFNCVYGFAVNFAVVSGNLTGIDGNISYDPLFQDYSNLDYSLSENSPCLDMGDTTSSLDPDGTNADLGCFPFFQDNSLPMRPMRLEVSNLETALKLEWTLNNAQNIDSFIIYRGSTPLPTSQYTTVPSSQREFIDFGVNPYVVYYYRIVSHSTLGQVSYFSNEASGYAHVPVLYVPSDYPTIQGAINLLAPGDTVFVEPGTYQEHINMKSGVSLVSTSGPDSTVLLLDLVNNSEVIYCSNVGSNTTIRGFKIQPYSASNSQARAIQINSGSNLNLESNLIVGTTSSNIYLVAVSASSPSIINNTIICVSGASSSSPIVLESFSYPKIINNILVGNGGSQCKAISTSTNSNPVHSYNYGYRCNSFGLTLGEGDVFTNDINPGFEHTTISMNDSYHLQSSSPCVDAGAPDFDGDGITFISDSDDQDEDSTRMDIGAFPFLAPIMHIEILDLVVESSQEITHLMNHFPQISFTYFNDLGEPQTNYQIQVSTHADFSLVDMWETGEATGDLLTTQYNGEPLQNGQTYYLRARVASGAFWSNWSSLQFRMNSTPTVPVPLSLINDEVTFGEVNLVVANSTDAEGDVLTYNYRLYADEALTVRLDSVMAFTEGPGTTVWNVNTSLEDNARN
ncbi:MAG: SBBP repeat-containing protein, partial [Candidatus Marinimicrobia bacterium]|nr:SBBP repeat-containing protein [Candidatus Neomarinimicrobiota bacterium]